MARTREGSRLTIEQRAEQLAVRARTLQGLLRLWPAVDPRNLSETIDVFTEAAVILAMRGHDESASVAARYLQLFRTAEDVPGTAPGVTVAALPRSGAEASLRGAALKGILDARRAGMTITQSKDTGLLKVAGTLAKIVLTGGWMTITGTVKRDRQALGWQRVGSDDPCAFCRLLISRGPVYKTEKDATFVPHENCACIAEPFYRGDSPRDQSREYADEYDQAKQWARDNPSGRRSKNPALADYRRWLAAGKPEPGQVNDVREDGSDGSTRG